MEGETRGRISRPATPSSPIPVTRIEKVDDEPRYGEVPGTAAYGMRQQDAVPDEIEIVPEGRTSRRASIHGGVQTPTTANDTTIPRMVVEKLDPEETSYGEEPGTRAYEMRKADATPDVVLKNPDPTQGSRYATRSGEKRSASREAIPRMIVTQSEDETNRGQVPSQSSDQYGAEEPGR